MPIEHQGASTYQKLESSSQSDRSMPDPRQLDCLVVTTHHKYVFVSHFYRHRKRELLIGWSCCWLVLLLVGLVVVWIATCMNNRTTGAVDKVEQIGACPILFTTRSRSATRLQYRTTTSINTCDSTGCCPILDYYCCYFYYYYHLLLDPLNNIHEHCEERE
jgi:hypothetical protein